MIYLDNLLILLIQYLVYFNTTCTVIFYFSEFTLLLVLVLYLLNVVSTFKNTLYTPFIGSTVLKFNSPKRILLVNPLRTLYSRLVFLNYLIVV